MSHEIIRGIIRPRGIIRGEANISSLAASGQLDVNSDGRFNVKQFEYVNVDTSSHYAEKDILQNGVYNASDEELYGYSKVSVNIVRGSAFLTPVYFDYKDAWVSNGGFFRSPGSKNLCDVYQVVMGRNYKLTFGQTVGTAARVMLTDADVLTDPRREIYGVALSNSTNPNKNWDLYFTAEMSGQVVIFKTSQAVYGIPTYLIDMTALGD